MSRGFELRTYTLTDGAAADRYASVHWARHIPSLATFGVTTHGVWREPDGRVVLALVSSAPDADPDEVTGRFLASDAFLADMDGFAMPDIVGVTTLRLEAAPRSPVR